MWSGIKSRWLLYSTQQFNRCVEHRSTNHSPLFHFSKNVPSFSMSCCRFAVFNVRHHWLWYNLTVWHRRIVECLLHRRVHSSLIVLWMGPQSRGNEHTQTHTMWPERKTPRALGGREDEAHNGWMALDVRARNEHWLNWIKWISFQEIFHVNKLNEMAFECFTAGHKWQTIFVVFCSFCVCVCVFAAMYLDWWF